MRFDSHSTLMIDPILQVGSLLKSPVGPGWGGWMKEPVADTPAKVASQKLSCASEDMESWATKLVGLWTLEQAV